MNRIPIVQVDAFAHAPFTGNPAAVMPLDAWLPDAVLQGIAAENNLSETAFTVKDAGEEADFELRWFTPAAEVALCGHATLASAHVLMGDGAIRFRSRRSGILTVEREGEDRYAMSLPAWAPHPRPLPELAAALGGTPVESWWHDSGYALFLYPDADAVRSLAPDMSALKARGNLLNIATAPGDGTDIVSRAFAPGGGVDEDPVTGSAHCVLTPFWAARLGRDRLSAYQASARGGYVDCTLEGDRVTLRGRCRTVMEGMFRL